MAAVNEAPQASVGAAAAGGAAMTTAAPPFPRYAPTRRRAAADAPLFAEGDKHREVAAKHALAQLSSSEAAALAAGGGRRGARQAAPAMAAGHVCSQCAARLPTEHLLALHLEEAHDSFFAARAAAGHKVFRCLVQSCHRAFGNAVERKQHLVDAHRYPRNFDFDKMHLRRRRGGQRHGPTNKLPVGDQTAAARPPEAPAEALGAAAPMDATDQDGLAAAMSRLSTADGGVPEQVRFGRRGRALAAMGGRRGGRGEGRGRGRQRMAVDLG